jgi:ribosome-associated protein
MIESEKEQEIEETEETDKKSKTRLKKEMIELQKLGEKLSQLSDSQIDQMPMPEKLKEALSFLKTITTHGARKRQLQYIGVLMREADPEPIQQTLANLQAGRRIDVASFLETETLRDALLGDDKKALSEILNRFPSMDRQHLNQLIRNAKKESCQNKPPRSARALFKYLKEFVENR